MSGENNISNIKLSFLENSTSATVAYADATLENLFVLKGIQVRQSKEGNLYVQLPQKKKGDEYKDIVVPLTAEARKNLNNALINPYEHIKFNQEVNRIIEQEKSEPKIDVKLSNKNLKGEKVKAIGSITVNNRFSINGVKVIAGLNGKFMSLPEYKTKSGDYKPVIIPASKDAFINLSEAVLAAERELNNGREQETATEKSQHTDKDADGLPDRIDSTYSKANTDTLDKDADGRNDKIDSQYNYKTVTPEEHETIKALNIEIKGSRFNENGNINIKYDKSVEDDVDKAIGMISSQKMTR